MKIRIPLRIVWDRLRATHLKNPWVSGLHNCPLPATQRPQVPGSRYKTRTTRTGLRSRFRSLSKFLSTEALDQAWPEPEARPTSSRGARVTNKRFFRVANATPKSTASVYRSTSLHQLARNTNVPRNSKVWIRRTLFFPRWQAFYFTDMKQNRKLLSIATSLILVHVSISFYLLTENIAKISKFWTQF